MSLDFRALFEASPNPYMVLDRELRFVAANAAYLAATTRRREELLGRHVTDVFPHDPADPNSESRRLLLASLARALEGKGVALEIDAESSALRPDLVLSDIEMPGEVAMRSCARCARRATPASHTHRRSR